MSENTKIEWATHTFNPWEGCQKVGPGCDHCYAENRNARFGGGTAVNWGSGAPRRRTSAANWRKPLAWNAAHEAFFAEHGYRQRVFCASLADVFDNAVDPQWRFDLLRLIIETPNLDWLMLTKRIGNAAGMLEQAMRAVNSQREGWVENYLPNVWIGATVVSQEEADRDIPKLLAVPAAKRFLSMEPLLGPVNLAYIAISGHGHHEFDPIIGANVLNRATAYPPLPQVDWVIVGGESGPGARPMHPDWVRDLRDQCAAADVPFMFKQWGEWAPHLSGAGGDEGGDLRRGHIRYLQGDGREPDGHFRRGDAAVSRVGKKAAGRLLDGIEHNGFPE